MSTSKFEDFFISLKPKFYVGDVRIRGAAASEIRDRIKDAFNKENIQIPLPTYIEYQKK